ncbi:MAG: hypothetical protein KAT28_00170 [Candidatus Aenigmarchaeota archaeon]|nr:hypothetical protein [Candidatus Aenigmarchaeota archaeon]
MVDGKNISDLIILNIDTEKFLEELVLNCPKLAGQIISRKPEYGAIIEEIVDDLTVNLGTSGRGYEQGNKYESMGLVKKALECYANNQPEGSRVKDLKALIEKYGIRSEWDYVNPDKINNLACKQVTDLYSGLDPFLGGYRYAIFFEKFD